jgi:tRNA (guanine37-N1)-methyltransferase
MRIDIISAFPTMFDPLRESIVGRAVNAELLDIFVHDLRDFARDRHKTVDDEPYGGGPGMVLKPDPLVAAAYHCLPSDRSARVILLTPRGRLYTDAYARELSRERHLVLLCGHYKGVDQRVSEIVVTDEISIGDYVLSGGEVPAMVVVDSVARLLPGAVHDEASVHSDSFVAGGLDHPHYTRPRVFMNLAVPEVLLSGDHAAIRLWRRREALRTTLTRRPDLLATMPLTDEDRVLLEELAQEESDDGCSGNGGTGEAQATRRGVPAGGHDPRVPQGQGEGC